MKILGEINIPILARIVDGLIRNKLSVT